MPKKYSIEIREAFGKEYLKVFLQDLNLLNDVQSLLQSLPSVRRANPTGSHGALSPAENLTVYPNEVYTTQELMSEVEMALQSYFSGGVYDPVFIDETIPLLGEAAYFKILDYILQIGGNLEKLPRATSHLNEEGLRDYLLPFLNAVSKGHSAAGEAFNKRGRTDILIQDIAGNNVFIAECKIWNGSAKLKEALDQLLERYVNWRDEKVALIVFTKHAADFSEVIRKAARTVSEHPNCLQLVGERGLTSISYLFRRSDDPQKKIKLELVLFNLSQSLTRR